MKNIVKHLWQHRLDAANDEVEAWQVYGQASTEAAEEFLQRLGEAATRLNRLLLFEETDEAWDVDVSQVGTVPTWEHDLLLNAKREDRFARLVFFFKIVVAALQAGVGPRVINTRYGPRFVRGALDRISSWGPVQDPKTVVQALWAWFWGVRRRWLKSVVLPPDVWINGRPACSLARKPVWLSASDLEVFRQVFRRLAAQYRVNLPVLEADAVRSHRIGKLQWQLAEIDDLEARALEKARRLSRENAWTSERVQKACQFFEELAERRDRTVAALEEVVIAQHLHELGNDLSFSVITEEEIFEALEVGL